MRKRKDPEPKSPQALLKRATPRVEAKRFRLPSRCGCGGGLVDLQLDGVAAIAAYECGSKWIGWEGPEGPAYIRPCEPKPDRRAATKRTPARVAAPVTPVLKKPPRKRSLEEWLFGP